MSIIYETNGDINAYCDKAPNIKSEIDEGGFTCPLCKGNMKHNCMRYRSIPKAFRDEHPKLKVQKVPIYQLRCETCRFYPLLRPDFFSAHKHNPVEEIIKVMEQVRTTPISQIDTSVSWNTCRRWKEEYATKFSNAIPKIVMAVEQVGMTIPFTSIPEGNGLESLVTVLECIISIFEEEIASETLKLANKQVATNFINHAVSRIGEFRYIIQQYKWNLNIFAHANYWLKCNFEKLLL
jgi:hypothetical protein